MNTTEKRLERLKELLIKKRRVNSMFKQLRRNKASIDKEIEKVVEELYLAE